MTAAALPTLSTLAAAQGGVFSRKQAVTTGWTSVQIETQLRRGTWVSVGYGCYAIVADSNPEYAHVRACAARILRTAGDLVVSHDSAGVLLELPYVDVPARPTLTLARSGRPAHRRGIFTASVPLDQRVSTFGLVGTSGPRTVVDLLRNASDEQAAQALVDGALRADVDPTEIARVLRFCAGWPGIVQARVALDFAEPLCESPLESHSRIWFRNGGLPAPTPQFRVRNALGKQVARVDFCFEAERVVVECDGQIKYAKGTSWKANPSDTLWEEKLREDVVREQGYEVVRAYAKDGKDGGADLCRRVRAAMARATRLHLT